MNKLSEKEIEAIRKRAEMATEGPWQKDGAIDIHSPNGTEVATAWGGYANQEFIAHAREDIPKLLAEIERLRSGLEALDKDISACLAYKLPFELIEISGYINDILHGGDDE